MDRDSEAAPPAGRAAPPAHAPPAGPVQGQPLPWALGNPEP